jgi:holo-[acyl-carrier protein] synthase
MHPPDVREYSIGVDIEEVDRIRRVADRWGDRFLQRHFTPGEIAYCRSKAHPAESLAARFAAKEAFAKAYPGKGGLTWHDVEVIKDGRRPVLHLRGVAAGYEATLSLSHTHEHAVAVVMVRPKRPREPAKGGQN